MPAESRERDLRPITGDEFESALGRAELLLAQADESRRRIGLYYAAVAGAWTASAVVAGAVGGARGLAALTVTAVVVALGNAAFTWRVVTAAVAPLREAMRRDERCAAESVGLLREVLPFIARDEDWSLFRTEEATLRISRFPIRGRKS